MDSGNRSCRTIGYVLGTFPALTETFVAREILALQQRGFRVVVLAVRRPDRESTGDPLGIGAAVGGRLYARPDNTARHFLANVRGLLRHPRGYFRGLSMFLRAALGLSPREAGRLLYHFFAGVGFGADARRLRVDHLHAHFNTATDLALAAHLVWGTPFSFTAHASGDLFVRPTLLSEKVAAARFVVAVSEYSRRFLDSVTGFRHSGKLERVYNGVSSRELNFNRAAAHAGGAGTELTIVSVGSLVGAKGYATLVEVCDRLVRRRVPVRCRIVGEGPDRHTLDRLISARGLEDGVQLLGALPLDRVYVELGRADVFVLLAEISQSGYRDGFPTVVLEAMSAGLPVVSTWMSGIPEMVEHGVTGLLVHERDIDGATEALARLAGDPGLRRRMGEAGQRRVLERFDADKAGDALSRLFDANRLAAIEPELIGRPGGPGQGESPAVAAGGKRGWPT